MRALFENNRATFEEKWKTVWKAHRMREGVSPLTERSRISVADFFRESSAGARVGPKLVLSRLIPMRIGVGQPVNPQPSGGSALVVECDNATPGTVINFDGELLQTTYANSHSLSAVLPRDFNREARGIPVYLTSSTGESNTLIFRVDP